MTEKRYLLQWGMTWNNLQQIRNSLKQPTTSMKWPETTYNKQETTWNDLQWARNDLRWSTTSKTQPTVTSTYLQQAKKKMQIDQQQADFQIILNIGQMVLFCLFHPTFGCNHSSIVSWRIVVKTECQASPYYHVYFFTGYKIFFLSGFCFKNIHKSQDSRERERLFFQLLSTTSTCFANRLVFSRCIYRRGLK